MRGAREHVVVGGLTIQAPRPALLISADPEDHVVGRGRDRQRDKQVDRKGGQSDEVPVGQHCDHTLGNLQLDSQREQHDQRGRYRTVDHQQHHRDHHQGDGGDPLNAFVAVLAAVGGQRTGAGDIGLDARRRRHGIDDALHRGDRLVGLGAALVAAQVQLHVGRFGVGALRARRGQRVTPEVVDVLDVGLVRRQFVDQLVVEAVCLIAELVLTFQQHHRGGVGIELLKVLADAQHRDRRRRIPGGHRHRVRRTDLIQ